MSRDCLPRDVWTVCGITPGKLIIICIHDANLPYSRCNLLNVLIYCEYGSATIAFFTAENFSDLRTVMLCTLAFIRWLYLLWLAFSVVVDVGVRARNELCS